ncbi:kinase-like protein, partial [Rozella allomycis CSF55]
THLDSFEIIKVLGKGSMGKVMLVREKSSGKLFALKSIHKNWVVKHREIEHTISERNILVKIREMNHPFLMKLHQSFQTDTELFLVIDYYPGGDLATQLARFYKFDEERARFYAAEMILGIKELHRNGVVYRDLKPENVLLANTGHLVLTDFGLSKMFRDESKTTTFCGTAEYLAPEILTSLAYDYKVDLWSFGTLLYEMLVGITPFWADNQSVMYQRVLSANLEFPEDISQDAKDLISKLLVRGAHNRLDCDGVQNHPFFKDVNWDDVYSLKLKPPYVPSIKNECDLSN